MINPISTQSRIASLQTTPKPGKVNNGTSTSSSSSNSAVDSPAVENRETPFQEAHESPSAKAAEALRTLSSQETSQFLSTSPKTITSPQTAIRAYQQSK